MRLSATGQRWINSMRRVYSHDTLEPVIERAERIARERRGREITRDDLNEALDQIAQQELVQACMNEVAWE